MSSTTSGARLACFKAYDLRGRIPDELDEGLAFRLGQVLGARRRPRKVVVGRDMRLSSPGLAAALSEGLLSMGVDVVDIGLCGTESVYFATSYLQPEGVDAGVMITASHNPADYNGVKLVGPGSCPLSSAELDELELAVREGSVTPGRARGRVERPWLMDAYIEKLLSFVDPADLAGMTIVSNPGNGCAGMVVEALQARMDLKLVKLHHEPDGRFPHGVPNPLLPENRGPTRDAVLARGADLGVAWDGDFDRCFLFDERGGFVEGYYIVGLLGAEFLRHHPGETIVYEPRLTWNTVELVQQGGGRPQLSRTGHAFLKQSLRDSGAIYGGEMSAHHYFRDFACCDSGMIPWLMVAGMMGRTGKSLSQLVGERQARFPCSGEINRSVSDAQRCLDAARLTFAGTALSTDLTDGLSMEFDDWRFNLRSSNTEPLLRLNVESRGDPELMQRRTDELLALIDAQG